MTNKEAIEYNKNLRMYMQITDKKSKHKFLKENYTALDMAIEALERDTVFDKIRAEIEEGYCVVNNDYDHGRNYGLYIATQIIDKYRTESED